MFVPVTGLEQAVALREAGLLYYVSDFVDIPELLPAHTLCPVGVSEQFACAHYRIQLED